MAECEALLNSFSAGLQVSEDLSFVHPNNRLLEFKGKPTRLDNQEKRRKDVLERQKQKRFDVITYARKLADGDLEEDEFYELSEDTMDQEDMMNRNDKKRFNPYKNQLMLSEWVIDPPGDLAVNWLMVICPEGKRVLVLAHKGQTTAYTKSGYALNRFPSLLPGGSFKKRAKNGNFSLIDCVYDELNRTFWMLDLMCFNGHPVYDSESEFRFFWLKTKMAEDCPEVAEISKVNPFKFKMCPRVPCTPESITNGVIASYPFKVDGVLFYHRLGRYRPGRTPLVGWLKPYMIQEVLGIPMPASVTEENVPAYFNRTILEESNVKLRDKLSDRSFVDTKKSTAGQKMQIELQEKDT